MASREKTLVVKLLGQGDFSGATRELTKFDAKLAQSQVATNRLARQIQDDARKMEAAFKDATAATAKLDQLGTGKAGSGVLGSTAKSRLFSGIEGAVSSRSAFGGEALNQLGGAEAAASKFGATTIAVTAGVAALAAGVGVLGAKSISTFTDLAEKVDAVQDVMGGTVREAQSLVLVSERWGVSAETLASAQAKLAVNVGKNRNQLEQMGVVIAQNDDGTTNLLGTLADVADAYNATNDPVQKAAILQAAYGKSWKDMVDVVERGGPAIRKAVKEAGDGPQVDPEIAKKFREEIVKTQQAFEKLAIETAPLLIPVLETGLKVTQAIARTLEDFIKVEASALSGLLGIGAKLHIPGADAARDAVDRWRDSLGEGGKAAVVFGDDAEGAGVAVRSGFTDPVLNAVANVTTLAGALGGFDAVWQGVVGDTRTAASVTGDYNSALSALDEFSVKATGSSSGLGDAQERAGEQIADAQKAVQDALEGVQGAQEDYARTVEDTDRRIVDAEEQAARKVEDARRRMRDSAQNLADAERDAILERSAAIGEDNPFERERKLEESSRKLRDAQQRYSDDQVDSAKDEADARKDVEDAHREAAQQIEDAQKRVGEAQDRVSEANERLERTSRDAARSVRSAGETASQQAPSHDELARAADRAVDATGREAEKMAALGATGPEIQAFLDTTRGHVDEFAQKWGFTADEVARLHREIDQIPRTVNLTYQLSLNASQFKEELRRAAGNLQDPLSRAYAELGAEAPAGFVYNFKGFDSGGVLPPGKTMAWNRTGHDEYVVNPSDPSSWMGGGSPVINIYASVIGTERELARMVSDAVRKGYAGLR